jgi:hypothetical protein
LTVKNLEGLGIFLVMGAAFPLVALRSKITVTDHVLVVQNPIRRRVFPLAEIIRCEPGYCGMTIDAGTEVLDTGTRTLPLPFGGRGRHRG